MRWAAGHTRVGNLVSRVATLNRRSYIGDTRKIYREAERLVERREIIFSGNVQGVGFRYSTHSIAANHQVSGYVRNQPSGSVQVKVEGSPSELDRFQTEIADRLSSHIRSVHTDSRPATGEFATFEIRT